MMKKLQLCMLLVCVGFYLPAMENEIKKFIFIDSKNKDICTFQQDKNSVFLESAFPTKSIFLSKNRDSINKMNYIEQEDILMNALLYELSLKKETPQERMNIVFMYSGNRVIHLNHDEKRLRKNDYAYTKDLQDDWKAIRKGYAQPGFLNKK
jgi:hypothetical protein